MKGEYFIADLKHAAKLLRMARKDMIAAQAMTDETIFADEIFGLHVQQSIEKALKAWLAVLDVEYPFSHDLAELFDILKTKGCEVEPYSDLIRYTPFAVQFRYDEFEADFMPMDRKEIGKKIEMLRG